MTKFTVELVKYDTLKTKKRKRKDLIVDAKTEAAVIDKLSKIHKGDEIEAVHEIIWAPLDEGEAFLKANPAERFQGRVKFFEVEKGFGFIKPRLEMDDLFFHASALGGIKVYDDDLVEFEISEGPKGLIAIRITSAGESS
jgi:CspA family cold shock protein